MGDRKIFFFDLKENQRGQMVKITEQVGTRRDTIIVGAEDFEQFADAVNAIRDEIRRRQ